MDHCEALVHYYCTLGGALGLYRKAAGGRTGTTSPGLLLLMLVVIGFCRRRSR